MFGIVAGYAWLWLVVHPCYPKRVPVHWAVVTLPASLSARAVLFGPRHVSAWEQHQVRLLGSHAMVW